MQATFGPFYRIEQLILSTTPAAQAPYQSPSGLPAILTDDNIRLLFQMQKAVDALAAPVAGSNASATLQQVCYKPLGNDCATQSVLQARLCPAAGILQMSIPFAASCRSSSGMTALLSDPMRMLQPHHAAIDGSRISISVRNAAHFKSYHDAVQFWKMDEGIYEHGTPPYGPPLSPEFCLGHWQTQCRSAI